MKPASEPVITGKILIIAEKPSVGRAISQALGTGERGDTFKHRKEGYIEGDRYTITWCIGHLVEPLEPEGYDERYKSWSYEDLPIIPDVWRYRARPETKKRYGIVAGLLNDRRFSEVVCATDAGREGETIFRKVYNLSGSKLPIKRLWISSMEDSAIREGFANLTDEQIRKLLKGESIRVSLRSRKGKDFDAILTPAGIRARTSEVFFYYLDE